MLCKLKTGQIRWWFVRMPTHRVRTSSSQQWSSSKISTLATQRSWVQIPPDWFACRFCTMWVGFSVGLLWNNSRFFFPPTSRNSNFLPQCLLSIGFLASLSFNVNLWTFVFYVVKKIPKPFNPLFNDSNNFCLFPQGMVQPATFPTRNLNGCIRDLQLGVSSFDLVRDFIVAENVENCFIAACDNVDCNGQGICVELVRMLA